ncbi:MAG: SBBP repeat-containing protein, partial [Bacteroidota bacterium]
MHSQNLVWAKQISGTDLNRGTAIALDASGNVYTLGVYRGTADFDPGVGVFNLTAKGNNDIFISKSNAAGDLIWALSMGDSAYDFGTSIAIDQSGNIYTTGCFSDIADFDPGTGIFNLTAVGSYDIFISKIDSSGNFVWAKQMGSPDFDFAYALALDDFGNVYSTGYFTDSADFDPGAGIFTMTSSGGRNVFISKLDSDGNFIWAKQFNGTGDDNCTAIKADALGNIYMTGVFNSTTDFDPGVLNYDLTSMGLNDNFIAKLDSSGNFQWAKQIGESGVDGALGLTLDHSANVITTGTFNGMCDFDPGAGTYNLTTIGNSDIYVSMLDSAGNFIWAKQMGGTANEYGAAITVDVSGNIYITGVFVGTCDFDPGSGIFNLNSSASSIDLFISKLDPSGNFQWALPFGG